MEPITRSTLSKATPSVQPLKLTEALPEAEDFGPGWTFDTESLGRHGYFEWLNRDSWASRECEGADPNEAGIAGLTRSRISATLQRQDDGAGVAVGVAVDSPASSADRVTFMRAVYEDCSEIEQEVPGETIVVEYEILDISGVEADQVLAVREHSESRKDGEVSRERTQIRAYARVGGLVVSLVGTGGADPRPLLPAALAEARTALNL